MSKELTEKFLLGNVKIDVNKEPIYFYVKIKGKVFLRSTSGVLADIFGSVEKIDYEVLSEVPTYEEYEIKKKNEGIK